MADREGRLFSEAVIEEDAGRTQEEHRFRFEKPKGRAAQVREDAVAQQDDAAREIAGCDERDAELAAEEASFGERHGPGLVGYILILLALFMLVWPVDYGAVQGLPLPPLLQMVLAVLIGAGMVLAADYAAKKIEDLRQSYDRREEDKFGFVQDSILLAVAISVPLLLIVGVTVWRGKTFEAESKAAAGFFDAGAANWAFAAIALLGFAVAVLAGLAFRRMQPLRRVRRERRKLRRERRKWQSLADEGERVQRQAELTLASLERREDNTLEAISHAAGKRKATLGHNAARQKGRVSRRDERRARRSTTKGAGKGFVIPIDRRHKGPDDNDEQAASGR